MSVRCIIWQLVYFYEVQSRFISRLFRCALTVCHSHLLNHIYGMDDSASLLSFQLSTGQGFHTTSVSRLVINHVPTSCALHLLYTLSSHIFADQYELGHHSQSYTSQILGKSNLEAPVFAIEDEDSLLFLRLAHPDTLTEPIIVNITVPLHLRYGLPSSGKPASGLTNVTVPSPVAFWACEDMSEFVAF